MLCIYSTTANITIAYNLGAIGGVMLGLQIASGVLVAMTYVASDEQSFATLDEESAQPRSKQLVHCYLISIHEGTRVSGLDPASPG